MKFQQWDKIGTGTAMRSFLVLKFFHMPKYLNMAFGGTVHFYNKNNYDKVPLFLFFKLFVINFQNIVSSEISQQKVIKKHFLKGQGHEI